MKKSLILIAFAALAFASCTEKSTDKPESMFTIVEYSRYNYTILYHNETKVMYAMAYESHVFTPLVDRDGKPLLWKGGK